MWRYKLPTGYYDYIYRATMHWHMHLAMVGCELTVDTLWGIWQLSGCKQVPIKCANRQYFLFAQVLMYLPNNRWHDRQRNYYNELRQNRLHQLRLCR
jgi:hypothetical protein